MCSNLGKNVGIWKIWERLLELGEICALGEIL
jgi:hypothetical protein